MAESPGPTEQLTVEDFAPRVGETFAVDAGEAGVLELKLVTATAVPAADTPREPFVLTFLGPAEPLLAQRTFRFSHPELETEIFIVAVGRDESGTSYEAVFA